MAKSKISASPKLKGSNAYGTKAARARVEARIRDDIYDRDRSDIDAIRNKPMGVDIGSKGPYTYQGATKLEKMAFDDARRRGAYDPAENLTAIIPEERKAKGGTVKKMAKGGSTASKRADGCATKGKTKGRFV